MSSMHTHTGTAPDPTVPAAPDATRHVRPGWRDPRILVGLLIVAGSILLGVKVVARADDTVGVWAARDDLPAGTVVGARDLGRVQVRFADAEQADRYVGAEAAPPTGSVLDRGVAAGELLPRRALGQSRDAVVEVPLAVAVDDVPATVRQGSEVDIWVTPQTAVTTDQLADATRVLTDVVVVRIPKAVDSLAPSGTRQVVVGVPRARSEDLGAALGQTAHGRVVITRRG